MLKIRGVLSVFLVALALVTARGAGPPPPASWIAIQPFGRVESGVLDACRTSVRDLFGMEVRVLPAAPVPPAAYYSPRKRYRAERLLSFLEDFPACSGGFKVLGVTGSDISTTKGRWEDWGIFGLGSLGGRTCVISTFRLHHGGAPRALFLARVRKVATHEVGHTMGLDHCPTPNCLMEDAAGTIGTVDREDGSLCSACRARLRR